MGTIAARTDRGSTQTMKCSTCGRRYRSGAADAEMWNAVMERGRMVAVLCPNCQTPEQSIEAEVNLATLTYTTDAFGRVFGTSKAAR